MVDLLKTLCAAPGAPGSEQAAAETAAGLLAQFCDVERGSLDSVIAKRPGPRPHILLDAHLDQIGMVVTGHEPGGFLRVAPCGAMDLRCLAAQAVAIHGKQPLFGVVPAAPPHLAKSGSDDKALDWPEIVIDTGLCDEDCHDLVPLGTRVTLRTPPAQLLGQRFTSPALDNRAGVAAILRCLELLGGGPACQATALFSAQEETGGAGAQTAAFSCQADACIVIDVSFAAAPGIAPTDAQGKLGGGVMIGIAPTLDAGMSAELEQLAQARGIPYQLEIMGGRTGTNADHIQRTRGGVPCALLSIPLRNMHTGAEVVDLNDIEAAARLMAAYLEVKGTAVI